MAFGIEFKSKPPPREVSPDVAPQIVRYVFAVVGQEGEFAGQIFPTTREALAAKLGVKQGSLRRPLSDLGTRFQVHDMVPDPAQTLKPKKAEMSELDYQSSNLAYVLGLLELLNGIQASPNNRRKNPLFFQAVREALSWLQNERTEELSEILRKNPPWLATLKEYLPDR